MTFNNSIIFDVSLEDNNKSIDLGTATVNLPNFPTPSHLILPNGELQPLKVSLDWITVTNDFTKLLTPGIHEIYMCRHYDEGDDLCMSMDVEFKSSEITNDFLESENDGITTKFDLYEWMVDTWYMHAKFDCDEAICKFNNINYLELALKPDD